MPLPTKPCLPKDELVALIPEGASIMAGGFMGAGTPNRLMDLVTGAKRVIIAMRHTPEGESKIVERCSLTLTSTRDGSRVVTDLAVIEPTDGGLALREQAPGVPVEEVIAATAATLVVPADVPEFQL